MPTVRRSDLDMLPHNPEAERAVLGACLVDPDAVMRCREVELEPGDFYGEAHRQIYQAIADLAARGRDVDLLNVVDLLRARENGHGTQLEALGGEAELAGLVSAAVARGTVAVAEHAAIVRRCAGQRRVLALAGELAELAGGFEGRLADLYEEAAQQALRTLDVRQPGSHLVGGDDALERYQLEQQRIRERLDADPNALVEVPWQSLHRRLGDLPGGYLHVVAAETSVGKSMYCENIAEYNAQRGHPVVFYHLELSHKTMLDRLMARWAGGDPHAQASVSLHQLQRGHWCVDIAQGFDAVRPWLGNMIYVHCPGWSAERISADVHRLRLQGRCELAVVDYLQKLALPRASSGQNAAMLIGEQVETLKTCAERIGIPMVLASQVNRHGRRDNRRPSMADIRNSGEVEEKANQIVVLHRAEKREQIYRRRGAEEIIEAHVDKNTTGEAQAAVVRLAHRFGRYMLVDLEEAEQELRQRAVEEIPF